ncbi:hypothetical protein K440DRAFT_633373 [Wilcoxina mikolae CBS 423.85]|nr:hypothetical protein K440DRAFT_633373 [Wilcoxina mikolae CBS 423.85]
MPLFSSLTFLPFFPSFLFFVLSFRLCLPFTFACFLSSVPLNYASVRLSLLLRI